MMAHMSTYDSQVSQTIRIRTLVTVEAAFPKEMKTLKYFPTDQL
jgi:hypothetical protein